MNEPRTFKQCAVCYNTVGSTATSSTSVFGKLNNSAHGQMLLWLNAWCTYTNVMIMIFLGNVNSRFGISNQPRWKSDWWFFAHVNIADDGGLDGSSGEGDQQLEWQETFWAPSRKSECGWITLAPPTWRWYISKTVLFFISRFRSEPWLSLCFQIHLRPQ